MSRDPDSDNLFPTDIAPVKPVVVDAGWLKRIDAHMEEHRDLMAGVRGELAEIRGDMKLGSERRRNQQAAIDKLERSQVSTESLEVIKTELKTVKETADGTRSVMVKVGVAVAIAVITGVLGGKALLDRPEPRVVYVQPSSEAHP